MAATYDVVTQRPGTEFLGGTSTRDVMLVGIKTKPSGIYLEFAVPRAQYPSVVDAAAIGWATIYETVATLDHVVGVQWGEVVKNGNLAANVIITVSSTSGDSEAELDVLVNDLGPKLHQQQIDALHAQLDQVEGT